MSTSGQFFGHGSQHAVKRANNSRSIGKNVGIVLLLPLLAGTSCMQANLQAQVQSNAEEQALHQAYTYKNLTIFPIQGDDQVARNYITLEEAMDQKMIILHETGNVGELSVDNKSDNHVFIMAGDIVKGGRQDRTIGEDIVLNPKSKKIPLKSFCVEQSRWRQRGNESAAAFSVSKKTLSNRNLKVAARSNKNQQEVWSEVSKYQDKASANTKADVKSAESQTSLQLTLENDKLKTMVDEYVKALQPAFEGKQDVLGFAFCVNGKVSTVETFGNAALFAKLQVKLLEAAANEAFTLYDESITFATPGWKDVEEFIVTADTGNETATETETNMTERKRITDQTVSFRVFNAGAGEYSLHTSIYFTGDIAENDAKTQQYQDGGYRRNNQINSMLQNRN